MPKPIFTKVLEIYPAANGGADISFYASDAMYSLRRDNPRFDEFYDLLQHARGTGSNVMVSATAVDFDIIEVERTLPSLQKEDTEEPAEIPEPMPIVPVSPERCAELFDMVNAITCTVDWLQTPCITFKFPASGCNVRAHVMCYMMIDAGATPEKMWINGNLHARSPNSPKCSVGWGWHVAPTLMVWQPIGPPIKMVLDPSLCDGPVTVEYWKALQNWPTAKLNCSAWHYYKYPAHGSATKEEAEIDMEELRQALLEQWTESPPPYHCPPAAS